MALFCLLNVFHAIRRQAVHDVDARDVYDRSAPEWIDSNFTAVCSIDWLFAPQSLWLSRSSVMAHVVFFDLPSTARIAFLLRRGCGIFGWSC
jgi:hypothetical protein